MSNGKQPGVAWRPAMDFLGLPEEAHLLIAETLGVRDRWVRTRRKPPPAAAALTGPPLGAALQGPPGGLLPPAVRRFAWLVLPPDCPGYEHVGYAGLDSTRTLAAPGGR